MTRPVFVSHAADDSPFVTEFNDRLLKLGCGLSNDQIFYSSNIATGARSGSDLMAEVRKHVGQASLVIAIITPTFQTRPVCVAEAGAAWGRSDDLFPIAAPGMDRSTMKGILGGMTIRHLDDEEALDELATRIEAVTNHKVAHGSWGMAKKRWLAEVNDLAANLPVPDVVSFDEHRALQDDLAQTSLALKEVQRELVQLKDKFADYREAEDAAVRAAILLPADEKARFESLEVTAARAVRELESIVQEALFYERTKGGMDWPDRFTDQERADAVSRAVEDGDLLDSEDGQVHIDRDIPKVARAADAVDELALFLDEASSDFDTWFRGEHDLPPDLGKRKVWDELL